MEIQYTSVPGGAQLYSNSGEALGFPVKEDHPASNSAVLAADVSPGRYWVIETDWPNAFVTRYDVTEAGWDSTCWSKVKGQGSPHSEWPAWIGRLKGFKRAKWHLLEEVTHRPVGSQP